MLRFCGMVLCSSSPSYFIPAASSREKINKPNIEINSARPRFRSSWVLRLKNRSGTVAQTGRLSIGQISQPDRIRLILPMPSRDTRPALCCASGDWVSAHETREKTRKIFRLFRLFSGQSLLSKLTFAPPSDVPQRDPRLQPRLGWGGQVGKAMRRRLNALVKPMRRWPPDFPVAGPSQFLGCQNEVASGTIEGL